MARQQIDTKGKTETFFTRNVKLITFLICITVIFSPFVGTYIQDMINARREAERPELTVDELVFIAERGKDLRQNGGAPHFRQRPCALFYQSGQSRSRKAGKQLPLYP